MTAAISELVTKALLARNASRELRRLSSLQKNDALYAIANALELRQESILESNAKDMDQGRSTGLSAALLDRLLLTEDRLFAMASDVRTNASLDAPVGEEIDQRVMDI